MSTQADTRPSELAKHDVVLTRVFAAPREDVFDAREGARDRPRAPARSGHRALPLRLAARSGWSAHDELESGPVEIYIPVAGSDGIGPFRRSSSRGRPHRGIRPRGDTQPGAAAASRRRRSLAPGETATRARVASHGVVAGLDEAPPAAAPRQPPRERDMVACHRLPERRSVSAAATAQTAGVSCRSRLVHALQRHALSGVLDLGLDITLSGGRARRGRRRPRAGSRRRRLRVRPRRAGPRRRPSSS